MSANKSELDHMLDVARLDADRLAFMERTLACAGVAGLVLTAIGAKNKIVLALALAISLGSVIASVYLRRRLERKRRALLTIELARDAFDHDAFLIHPYRGLLDLPVEEPVTASLPRRPIGNVLAIVALLGSIIAIGGTFGRVAPVQQRWTFLEMTTPSDLGLHPSPLRTGEWRLEDHDEATGARALVNQEGEALAPPATIVARSAWMRDFSAVTRCKTDPARDVQQCGIVYRFRDEAHYDLVRLDTKKKEVVLASIDGSGERIVGRAPADATAAVWHELKVDASGGVVQATWNGRKLIEVVETIPATSGSVGLWAPASGIAWFDELAIEGRIESPHPLEIVPLLGRTRS